MATGPGQWRGHIIHGIYLVPSDVQYDERRAQRLEEAVFLTAGWLSVYGRQNADLPMIGSHVATMRVPDPLRRYQTNSSVPWSTIAYVRSQIKARGRDTSDPKKAYLVAVAGLEEIPFGLSPSASGYGFSYTPGLSGLALVADSHWFGLTYWNVRHEIGHCLGLSHPSVNFVNVSWMYPGSTAEYLLGEQWTTLNAWGALSDP